MLMHCHKDRVDALDLITVAKTFIDANDRDARSFFGSFRGPTVGRITSHLLFVLRIAIARLKLQCTTFRCVL